MTQHFRIRGAGGGGGSKKGGDKSENTLRSKARARLIEAISEGEIEGLVDGERSIFFDQTPIKNADGSYNFKNVIWAERKGLPDQDHFTGFSAVETPVDVEVQVKKSTGPVQRTVSNVNLDALRLIVRLNALFQQDEDDGKLRPASVSYAIDVRANAGSWQEMVVNDIVNEKTTSPTQFAHRVELPLDGAPWDVRVRRITDDSEEDELQNDIYWESYVELIEGKFTYPHTAAVAVEVNAEDMGSSIPPRKYHVRGIICEVPSNYDPVTRTYSGLWNGTFKRAYTNCPPWIFRDLVINNRYGLGEFIDTAKVDKWSLYTIAQYCDQQVKSGYKNGDTGEDIYEPRFTFNGVINRREEAYLLLQQMAAAWRGMSYWSLGQVFATADMPSDPAKLVSPANVIDGEFVYSGTSLKARHSVCIVKWNDPQDFFRPTTEVVINEAMLKRYGWREKTVQMRGCATRGLAHRYGKWVLDTEQHENETVVYRASWDHADVRPGDIIALSDPNKAQVRAGGRIVEHSGVTVTLDGDFSPGIGETYQLMVSMPDGSIETSDISAFPASNQIMLGSGFSTQIAPNAMFAITGTDIAPRQFRVLARDEVEKNIFEITALFHDPDKFARVEEGIVFEPRPYYRPRVLAYAPIAMDVRETAYVEGANTKSRLTISWTPSQVMSQARFQVIATTPDGHIVDSGIIDARSFEINEVIAGTYSIAIHAVAVNGLVSDPLEDTFIAIGRAGVPAPTVTNLHLTDRPGSNVFVGRDVLLSWENNFASSSVATSNQGAHAHVASPLYAYNTIKIYDNATATLLRTQRVQGERFVYIFDMNKADCVTAGLGFPCRSLRFDVTVTDIYGRTSPIETGSFVNPQPGQMGYVYETTERSIDFTFSGIEDEDFAGILIWREEMSGFNPLTTTPLIETNSKTVSIPGNIDTTYYVRFAAFDAFGKDGLTISPEIIVATRPNFFDTTPPAVPTGLALSSELQSDGSVRLTATWNANTEDDLGYYDIEVKEGAGNYVSFQTSTNRHEWTVRPGISFAAHVRAVDQMGNRSSFSAPPVTHTSATDTIPPAVPAGLTAAGTFKAIWLEWSANTEFDLARYEIYESDTAVAPSVGETDVFQAFGTQLVRSDLPAGAVRYYWIRAVDTSGNKSAWSAMQSATVATLQAPDVDAVMASTIYASSIEVPDRVASLPALPYPKKKVYLSSTSTMYVQSGGQWVEEGSATLIVGKLVAGQLGVNSVGAEQISAKSITVDKLAVVGRSTAINPDPHFEDDATWTNPSVGPTPSTVQSQYAPGGTRVLIAPAGNVYYENHKFPIDRTKTYLVEWIVASNDPGTFYGVHRFYNGSNAILGSGGGSWSFGSDNHYFPSATPLTPAYQRFATQIGANTDRPLPAGTTQMALGYLANNGGSGQTNIGMVRITEVTRGELIVQGAITADKLAAANVVTLSAQIADAIITDAKIVSLSAAKIQAGTVLAGSVTVSGTALSDTTSRAADPAARINAAATRIDPGKITITGSTTLSDWRKGGDETKIDGGAISANTVDANKLTIGQRGIQLLDIQFEHNSPSANVLSWTGGYIVYVNDAGTTTTTLISAGQSTWTSGWVYIYWLKGQSTLYATSSYGVAVAADTVLLATYKGGTNLVVHSGRTIIDGSHIKTGTVDAQQIKASAIQAIHIASDTVESRHVKASQISAAHLVVKSGGRALNPDPYMEDERLWDNPSQKGSTNCYTYATNWSVAGGRILHMSKGTNYWDDTKTAIDSNKTYALAIRAGVSASGSTFYGVWRFWDASGNLLGTSSGSWVSGSGNHYYPANYALSTTPQIFELVIGAGTTYPIPTNAKTVSIGFLADNNNVGADTYVDYVTITEQVRTVEIKDGAITADKVVSNSIETRHLQAESVTLEKLSVTGRNLVNDPGLSESKDGWSNQSLWSIGSPSGLTYDRGIAMSSSGDLRVESAFIPIDPAKSYRATASFWDARTAAGNPGASYFGVWAYDKNFNHISIHRYDAVSRASIGGSPYFYAWSGKADGERMITTYIGGRGSDVNDLPKAQNAFLVAKLPNEARYVKLQLLNYSNAGHLGHMWIGNLSLQDADSGKIRAQQIETNSLSAISATLGNVDISQANIGSLTVGSSNIATGALVYADSATGSVVSVSTNYVTLVTLPAIGSSSATNKKRRITFYCEVAYSGVGASELTGPHNYTFQLLKNGTPVKTQTETFLIIDQGDSGGGGNKLLRASATVFMRFLDTASLANGDVYSVRAVKDATPAWSAPLKNINLDVDEFRRAA